MELTLEEQALLTLFRSLDDAARRELLRHASLQQKMDEAASAASQAPQTGQCRLERGEERPETVAEPIFTE